MGKQILLVFLRLCRKTYACAHACISWGNMKNQKLQKNDEENKRAGLHSRIHKMQNE